MSHLTSPCFAVVSETFIGEPGELSLDDGEIVIVVMVEEDGWVNVLSKRMGEQSGGIFPSSYLDFFKPLPIPCNAIMTDAVMELGLLPGEPVKITELLLDGIMVDGGPSSIGLCQWHQIDIKEVVKKKVVPVSSGGSLGRVPKRPVSVIKEPLQLVKKPLAPPRKVNALVSTPVAPPRKKANFVSNTLQTKPKTVNTAPKQAKTIRITSPKTPNNNTGLDNRPTRAKPGEMHNSRFSTYKRPISVFASTLRHGEFTDISNNIYEIGTNNGPTYELEGRFEFRATADIPPPPTFQGIEKSYVTIQPSFVDWEAKLRSSQFDI